MTGGGIPMASDDIGSKSADYVSFSGQNRKLLGPYKLMFLTSMFARSERLEHFGAFGGPIPGSSRRARWTCTACRASGPLPSRESWSP